MQPRAHPPFHEAWEVAMLKLQALAHDVCPETLHHI